MRLYVNDSDISVLQRALLNFATNDQHTIPDRIKATLLFERVNLCEALQNNQRRSEGHK